MPFGSLLAAPKSCTTVAPIWRITAMLPNNWGIFMKKFSTE